MLKIAVVDDEDTFRDKLVGYLKQYASERKNEMTVDVYPDGISFLNELPRGYDVVFLDIAMPLLDGMETAKKIRKQDTEIAIVFVTTLAQYAVNGYEVGASDFLVKPFEYTLFALKADRIFRGRKVRKGEEISLKTVEEGFVRLALSDILYVESDQHYNTFYCPRGKYVVRSSMKEVEKMLIDKHFCRCATSYLVNLDHVSKIYQNTVYLSSGQQLPLTRTKSQTFMNAFTVYLGGRG
jgi:DNA-binding LytR/AlgR family response regulator